MRAILALLLMLALAGGVLAQDVPAPTDLNRRHPLAQGLQAWWIVHPHLAAGPTWWTLVGQTHGTLTNMGSGSGWQPATRSGSAGELRFDGTDDYVSIPATAVHNFDMTKSYSWAFRVKSQSTAQWHTLWAMLDTAGGSNYFAIYLHASGNPNWGGTVGTAPVVAAGITTTGPYEIITSTDNAITTGVWYSIVVTYNGTASPGGRFRLYVNAVDVSSTVHFLGTSTTVTAGVVRLGSDTYGDPTLSGSVNEVGVWGRALSSTDVQALSQMAAPTYGGLLTPPALALVGPPGPVRRRVTVP